MGCAFAQPIFYWRNLFRIQVVQSILDLHFIQSGQFLFASNKSIPLHISRLPFSKSRFTKSLFTISYNKIKEKKKATLICTLPSIRPSPLNFPLNMALLPAESNAILPHITYPAPLKFCSIGVLLYLRQGFLGPYGPLQHLELKQGTCCLFPFLVFPNSGKFAFFFNGVLYWQDESAYLLHGLNKAYIQVSIYPMLEALP